MKTEKPQAFVNVCLTLVALETSLAVTDISMNSYADIVTGIVAHRAIAARVGCTLVEVNFTLKPSEAIFAAAVERVNCINSRACTPVHARAAGAFVGIHLAVFSNIPTYARASVSESCYHAVCGGGVLAACAILARVRGTLIDVVLTVVTGKTKGAFAFVSV